MVNWWTTAQNGSTSVVMNILLRVIWQYLTFRSKTADCMIVTLAYTPLLLPWYVSCSAFFIKLRLSSSVYKMLCQKLEWWRRRRRRRPQRQQNNDNNNNDNRTVPKERKPPTNRLTSTKSTMIFLPPYQTAYRRHHSDSLCQFRRQLKTFLFVKD